MSLLALLLGGCAGVQTFPNVARSGDTIAVAAGWKQQFARQDLSVIIVAVDGRVVVYPPGDPAVRAVVNFYPDPLSSIVVSDRINQDLTPYARTYADAVNQNFTNGDPDWWQTTVFVDLPTGLAVGTANVTVVNRQGFSTTTQVQIIPGVGSPAPFAAQVVGPLQAQQLAALERVPHYALRFSGVTLPHAIQLDLQHAPDAAHGGSGRAHVVNPRGDQKNIAWRDDGQHLRVLITPVRDGALDSFADFKFYVAGGVTNLTLVSLRAVDVDGNTVPGVNVELLPGH